jgi:hypothetical protein
MYRYDVTLIVPGIRTQFWEKMYDSLSPSFGSKTFEVIFVGPNDCPQALTEKDNVTFIKDFGHPNRCQQIAASKASGKYISWFADDAVAKPGAYEIVINSLEGLTENDAACCKFLESDNPSPSMWGDDYYHVNNSTWTRCDFIQNDQLIMNVGVVHEKVFREIGGFDTNLFECTAMAHSDLAIRLTHIGVKIHLFNLIVMHCGFTPGDSGDHGPVFAAHHDSDIPNFRNLYSSKGSLGRSRIEFDNWKSTEAKWSRRFGNA